MDVFTIKWDNRQKMFFTAAGTKTNCQVYEGYTDTRENIQKLVDQLNGTNPGRAIKCKNCHRYFFIPQNEEEWYKENDYDLPKRCKPCRRMRRLYGYIV